MAHISHINAADRQPVNWSKWLLIGIGVLVSLLLLVVPMISIFYEALKMGLGVAFQNLGDSDMLHAIWL
ncbi:MAG: sulfate/thiosulfate ABC transporter permease CysW, partial [Pantoea sp.]|nr:sulfate/thiosulfate ABC transporter permease CysW [Pantoea sp.]